MPLLLSVFIITWLCLAFILHLLKYLKKSLLLGKMEIFLIDQHNWNIKEFLYRYTSYFCYCYTLLWFLYSQYWDFALTVYLDEIVYIHCHQQRKLIHVSQFFYNPFLIVVLKHSLCLVLGRGRRGFSAFFSQLLLVSSFFLTNFLCFLYCCCFCYF